MGAITVLPPLLPACSHGILKMQYTFQEVLSLNLNRTKRVWTKGDYHTISRKLGEVDWEFELANKSTQQMYDSFLTIVNRLIDRYVPSVPIRDSKPPWSLNPPRDMVRRKGQLFNRYKSVRSVRGRRHPETLEAWREFVTANNDIKQFALHSQRNYENSIADQLKTNPKLFHSYLRHRRVGRPSVGPLKMADGSITDDPALMAERFAESFLRVFTDNVPLNPAPNQVSDASLSDIIVTPEDVDKEIKTLDVNSCPGADGIHPRFLARCSSAVSLPLSIIFNSSLSEGSLPSEWLASQIAPIFKKGARTDPLNYRPVSLTSVPCKVLEKIIVKHLRAYLEENELLSNEQYGFRSSRSTIDQLIMTYSDITSEVNRRNIVDLIFFDFSKAFDKVCHSILLLKLANIGVNAQLLIWIGNFLVERKMQVTVMGAASDWHRVRSGVPQGSVLGPILFLIYVNHVVHNLQCNYKIFADDIKLYVSGASNDPTVGHPGLQSDIATLVATSASWGLVMNVDKCVCIRFGPKTMNSCSVGESPYQINSARIKFSAGHSDLGVKVDGKLKFHDHIRSTANVCNALSTNIFSSTLCRQTNFILTTYKSLIRPKLEYGSAIWNLGYLGDLRSLERVQRRWTRQIQGLENISYADRLRILNLFSVQGRLLRADLIQTWKIMSGLCALDPAKLFILDGSSRRGHSKKLFLPRTNLEVRRRFFSVRVVKTWNALSEEAVSSTTLNQFKSFLHRDLAQELYKFAD